jgi:hypothetical protein
MFAEDLLQFRNDLYNWGVLFCYSGYLNEAVLESIGTAMRVKLENDTSDPKLARTLFSVFVEQVQNVVRYSAEVEVVDRDGAPPELRHGLLAVGKDAGGHFVTVGNLMLTADVPRLRRDLSEIQKLDKQALTARYREILRAPPPEGSKGAGAGFTHIARLATRGIEFGFQEVENGLSFFGLKAML